ncbi:MAG: hypothetical protein EOO77_23580 [Oxalobacteraceae bacterium]|nr:MAG: hypothetical protein EOO77_23580 [Oxalobacteraceae bacterium]
MEHSFTLCQITDTTSGRFYVECARNAQRCWVRHRRTLDLGTHDNRGLQQAWEKSGADAFTFAALAAFGTLDEAREAERALLDQYRGKANCFNLVSDGRRQAPSAETCEKISAKLKGRPLTDEHKARIGRGLIGHPVSAETRAKIGASRKTFRHTEETKARIAESSRKPRGPHRTSDQTIYRFRNKETGEVVEANAYDLRERFNLDRTMITRLISGRSVSHRGWVVER